MRRVVVLAALALAGCGADPEVPAPLSQQLARPVAKAPELRGLRAEPTKAALAARAPDLDPDSVAVVDLAGRIGVEPRRVWVAKDAEVVRLRWSRWDASGAAGRGVMRSVSCAPDCARGGRVEEDVELRLSRPVSCPHGRFFDAGSVHSGSGPAEQTWLAAPC